MQSLSAALPRMSAFHAVVCLMLSVQNSSYVLLRRYSSGVLHEAASAQAILAVGELIKMGFSWYMIVRDASSGGSKAEDAEVGAAGWTQGGARVGSARWFAGTSARLLFSSAAMAVPAGLFLAMNLLSFVALERISASSFTLIQQTKIVFTALLSRALLGKVLSPSRWRALLSLLFAVLIICQQTQPPPRVACPGADAEGGASNMQRAVEGCRDAAASELEWHAYAVGVAAVTTEAVRSGHTHPAVCGACACCSGDTLPSPA
jgi:UDP-sugar transporter A1/2/3